MAVIQIAAGILAILFYASVVWFSVRAKRLGTKSYRWATYIALTSAPIGLIMGGLSETPIKNGYTTGAVTLLL